MLSKSAANVRVGVSRHKIRHIPPVQVYVHIPARDGLSHICTGLHGCHSLLLRLT